MWSREEANGPYDSQLPIPGKEAWRRNVGSGLLELAALCGGTRSGRSVADAIDVIIGMRTHMVAANRAGGRH